LVTTIFASLGSNSRFKARSMGGREQAVTKTILAINAIKKIWRLIKTLHFSKNFQHQENPSSEEV
jgi:hypothetical protein